MTRIVRPGVDTGILGRTAGGKGPVRALTMKELATALQQPQNLGKTIIPTTHSIPAGGATGQVLEKNSNTDYDVSWHTLSSGGGLTTIGIPPSFNPTVGVSLATNFFFGRTIVVPEAISISKVVVPFQSSQASAKLQPCIYAVSIAGGTFGALLASGAVVTGAVKGVQSLPLTAPLVLSKGDIIMFGFICGTAAPNTCATFNNEAIQFMAATTGSPPNPASGVTDNARTWGTFWLSA